MFKRTKNLKKNLKVTKKLKQSICQVPQSGCYKSENFRYRYNSLLPMLEKFLEHHVSWAYVFVNFKPKLIDQKNVQQN